MKVNKKGVLAISALIAGGALVLSGCAGGGGDNGDNGGDDNSTPITVWVDIERKPALEEVAASFTAETGVEEKLDT